MVAAAIHHAWGYRCIDLDGLRGTEPGLLAQLVEGSEPCVLAGDPRGWDEAMLGRVELGVFVSAPTETRVDRLLRRAHARFGMRVLPGGDLADAYVALIARARAYDSGTMARCSRSAHLRWLDRLGCPVVQVDGSGPISTILSQIADLGSAPPGVLQGARRCA